MRCFFKPAVFIWCAWTVALAQPFCQTSPVRAAELLVGTAVADITPPVGYRMSGYFSERLSTGTRDPLMAKALVLAQGETKAALVFCDLIGMTAQVSAKARAEASRMTGIPADHISIAATHSHTGPLYAGALRNYFHEQAVARDGKDKQEEVDYPKLLVERLAGCIEEAHRGLAPARLAAGIAEQSPPLSFNRRFHMRDGTVKFNPGQQNPDIVRVAGPIDPQVGMLAVSADDGRPTAVLTVLALHLDTVGGTLYSADYPFFLERALREHAGDGVVSLFGAGTCGDVNHIDVSIEGRRGAEEIGTLLGTTVAQTLPSLEPVTSPSLAVRSTIVAAPLQQYPAEQVELAARNMALIGSRELSFLEQVEACKITSLQSYPTPHLPLEVQAFRLDAQTAVVTLPGEVFVELGLAIKQGSPFKTTLVIELANDAPAYIPTEKAFAEGSYETVNSRIRTGGGELMVEAALRLLAELDAN